MTTVVGEGRSRGSGVHHRDGSRYIEMVYLPCLRLGTAFDPATLTAFASLYMYVFVTGHVVPLSSPIRRRQGDVKICKQANLVIVPPFHAIRTNPPRRKHGHPLFLQDMPLISHDLASCASLSDGGPFADEDARIRAKVSPGLLLRPLVCRSANGGGIACCACIAQHPLTRHIIRTTPGISVTVKDVLVNFRQLHDPLLTKLRVAYSC